MAFMIDRNVIFIDSFQFMSESLYHPVNNLPKDGFYHTKNEFGSNNLELITRKCVYPYDYMDDFNKFKEEGLPSIELVKILVIMIIIMLKMFGKNLNVKKKNGDYHDLYLKSDVLILVDIFENFRKTCKEYYNLNPAHYFSCPGFAWDAMLKMTGINLELITDIDMYQMVETGLRG